MQRLTIDGHRRDIGLGGFPAVSLARAREKAFENRTAAADGRDPLADRHHPAIPTLRQAAEAVCEANRPRWRSSKHAANWMQMLERHVLRTLGDQRVDCITTRDVLGVLTPIWTSRPETARRIRQRLRAIFRWAMAHEYIDRNLAGEAIDGALPTMPTARKHFRALPYAEVATALETVEGSGASMPAKLCIRFLVLTAARSGEARGARWHEVDLGARVWVIPADRMKGNVEHRVPLSDAAVEVLAQARRISDGSDLIFPSPLKPGRQMSDMTLTKLLRDNDLAQRATVHGFRSSFRDWAAEQTDTPYAVMELALAHRVGSAVEQAYFRSDLMAKRRELMDRWANFVATARP